MIDDYSTIDIQNILGLPRERFREWILKGFVCPSVPSSGQGSRASFTRENIYMVEFLHRLILGGMKRSIAAKICHGADFSKPSYQYDFPGGLMSAIYNLDKIKRFVDARIVGWRK